MKKIMICSLATVLVMGCTSDFKEMNQDKYGITDVQLATVPIGSSDLQAMSQFSIGNQENAWQMYFDLTGNFSSYTAASNFISDYNAYNPRVGWVNYVFDDAFKHLYPHYNAIKNFCKGDESKPIFALAQVVRIMVTQRLSDIFGPMPYSKINGVELKVPYDRQRDLYLNMLEDLKKATEVLDAVPEGYNLYGDFDKIYKSDMKLWAKFGRSLMLRMAVRMAKQEPEKAKEFAEYAVSKGIIETNEQNALMPTNDNPVHKVSESWGDSRVGADIVEYMKAFSDPRLVKYFTLVESRGNQPFGLRVGAPVAVKGSDNLKNYSCPNVKVDDPMVIMSAAEVAFLKAEGALNGWNMGADAETLYNKGIQLSCEQWGVKVGDYLNNENRRHGFIDNLMPRLNDNQFTSDITVKWSNANGDKERLLSKIITQKWIAMFPYGTIEGWTEWRRTGYPNLMPSLNNQSAGIVQNITQVDGKDVGGMRRLPFSTTATGENAVNLKEAVQMLGGPDNAATDLWWAK